MRVSAIYNRIGSISAATRQVGMIGSRRLIGMTGMIGMIGVIGVIGLTALPAMGQHAGVELGKSVRINGYTKAYFETSNQARFGQLVPKTRFRWEFAPTLFVKGVPLAFSAMYSTEDNEIGRSVGGFAVSLNLGTNELESIIRDRIDAEVSSLANQALSETGAGDVVSTADDVVGQASNIQQTAEERLGQLQDLRGDLDNARPSLSQLQEMGLMTAQERLAMRFPALGLGTTYPTHSPYTVNGIAVNGVNVEFAPGSVLLGVAVGRVRDPISSNNRFLIGIDSVSYDRSMYAARIGAGRPDGKHFLISGTYFSDKTSEDSLLFFAARRPEENAVVGISTRWSDPTRTVNIHGEFAASVYTRDRQGAELADEIPGPQFLKNAITVNSTSSGDFAGRGGFDLRLRPQALKVDGFYEQVGPGYVTLGNPLLRSDFRKFGGGFEKQFARRQVAVSASLRQDENNLSGFQLYTTTSRTIRTRLSLRFRGKPYATIQFSPTTQDVDVAEGGAIGTSITEYRSSILNVAAGHHYKLGGSVSANTSVNVSNQSTSTDADGFDFSTTVLSLAQSVTVSMFTVAGQASLFRQRDVATPMNSNIFDIGVSLEPLRGVQTTVGVNMFDDIDRSTERGIYASVSADAGPVGTVFARIEASKFTDQLFDSRSFTQTMVTATVLKRW